MSDLSRDTVEDIESLAESQYLSIPGSKSGGPLKAVPKISKNLVAYLEGLLAVSPYASGAFDPRAKGVAEAAAMEALTALNKHTNEAYMSYLKRKLGDWYREAPRPERKQAGADEPEELPAPAEGIDEDVPDTEPAAGAGVGGGFSLD